ncbi:hypothetical protein FBZ82_12615 [Azospirillum brasilense]|uniref:DNA-binding protein n=1 Tax=Azospirillum brasilense TaxID=192 RepID=A0A560AFV1_AZOBR|nr:DNA-binding protein [Azospirillum brasilense]TWA59254.1 hypothetical protein FBZ82_12615 [Azospirillum brasilense]
MSAQQIIARYLRSKAAAQYCGYAEASFRTYRVKGGGPRFIKRNRIVLYDVADLDAWIGSERRGSTSETGAAR